MKYPCSDCKEVREKDYYGYIGICDKCKKRIEYDNWAHQQMIEQLKKKLNKK